MVQNSTRTAQRSISIKIPKNYDSPLQTATGVAQVRTTHSIKRKKYANKKETTRKANSAVGSDDGV